MRKLLIGICATVALTSCAANPRALTTPETPIIASEPLSGGYVYLAVLEVLLNEVRTDGLRYVSVDMSDALYGGRDEFLRLARKFCASRGCEMLTLTLDELVDAGYIDRAEWRFDDGVLITFDDESVSPHRLVTYATAWRSGATAFASRFAVELGN
ncbi:MAG: hypothetical protein LBN02_07405 [Oscillospiraceae bacterium]|jgi:hypothetical protein|nr:hypothetical protein [Oscillospiraceae bacterium]